MPPQLDHLAGYPAIEGAMIHCSATETLIYIKASLLGISNEVLPRSTPRSALRLQALVRWGVEPVVVYLCHAQGDPPAVD
jgi:hypothetical protein